jgi:asparagine synthase (glutamine-hydrolysing)
MCGIAGYVDDGAVPQVREAAVTRMCETMLHRGPDDAGLATHGAATLGMRRLAIFDPAHGHQPMATADGRFHLVFNGALYNFRALRDELAGRGHSFRTECDTEVLLNAFAEWGPPCVDRLRGMFAFAVWDARDASLFLARDPFGIKPLFYRLENGRLLFASEIKALLAAGAFDGHIDPSAVADYLGWFAVPAPRTIYRDVRSLQPGECGLFRAGKFETKSGGPFRSLGQPAPACRSQEDFEHELRARLDDTIRAHVVADVPLGAFLSGGVDSAAVVGLMTRATGTRLKTFTVGFEDAAWDESLAAEKVARHFGTEHHTRLLTGAEVAADLPRLLASYDQPTGDGVNTYYACQTARAGGLTVVLSGLGGDELVGGYPSFRDIPRLKRWLPFWHKAPPPIRRFVLQNLRSRDARHRKLADFLEHARSLHELCSMHRRVFAESDWRQLLAPDACTAAGELHRHHPTLPTLSAELEGAGTFETISAWELRTYMADVLLRDSDVMSMRHSLELRVPFIDRPLVEWLWCQPARFKSDTRQPKGALIRALRDVFPAGFGQGEKQGFSLPFPTWMRRELRPFLDATFDRTSISASGLFATEPVQRLWKDYLARNDSRQWSRVWALAVLVDFANRRSVSTATRTAASPIVLTPKTPSDSGAASSAHASSKTTQGHRTVLLAPQLFESEGGIPRILRTYLKALCELAAPSGSVRFVALNDTSVDATELRRSANERLTEWRVCARNKRRFITAALELSRGCDRLICGHVAQLPVAFLAKLLNPRLRYFLVAHGIEVWRPFTLAERLALRHAARILCVSDHTRRELLRHCPLPEGRAVVLHNALDPCFRIAPGAPRQEQASVILAVTRITKADRYKGVEDLIAAMPTIRAGIPAAVLRIIGRGDDLARLRALRDQLGLHDAVEFMGYVDDERMAQEMRTCSLFALPSQREGFGLVFLEAMANGRPCLGARAGGVPEVMSADTGVLVDYGDVPGIASACVDALRREWSEPAILERARLFSFEPFKDRLATELDEWGASQFADMGGTPMPRGTGILPVGLQKTKMRSAE